MKDTLFFFPHFCVVVVGAAAAAIGRNGAWVTRDKPCLSHHSLSPDPLLLLGTCLPPAWVNTWLTLSLIDALALYCCCQAQSFSCKVMQLWVKKRTINQNDYSESSWERTEIGLSDYSTRHVLATSASVLLVFHASQSTLLAVMNGAPDEKENEKKISTSKAINKAS